MASVLAVDGSHEIAAVTHAVLISLWDGPLHPHFPITDKKWEYRKVPLVDPGGIHLYDNPFRPQSVVAGRRRPSST